LEITPPLMDLKKEKEREGKPENWEKIREEKRE